MAVQNVPRHVGIIMDGNRRWAQKKHFPRLLGHKRGAEKAERIVRHAFKRGVQFVTLYAFSTENWNRPQEEIDHIMDIFRKGFDEQFSRLADEDVSVHFIGDRTAFPEDIQQSMAKITARSRGREKVLIVAMGYGGRDEIVRMARRVVACCSVDMYLDEHTFGSFRDAYFAPDIDLIIRTGGRPRPSGFCMWQSPYANFLVTDTLWPAFSEKEFDKLLKKNARYAQNHGK